MIPRVLRKKSVTNPPYQAPVTVRVIRAWGEEKPIKIMKEIENVKAYDYRLR